MVDADGEADGLSGLVGINLPGVEIENSRFASTGQGPETPPKDCRGEKSQIGATGPGEVRVSETPSRHREFLDGAAFGQAQAARVPWEVGDSIAVMPDGKDRGVIIEALFGENIQGPKRLVGDRITGRSIAANPAPAGVLDRLPGTLEVVGECLTSQFIDQLMAVAMARNLVAAIRNFSNQGWLSLGNPAKDKEGAPNTVAVKGIEQPPRILKNAARLSVPVGSIDNVIKIGDLEVVLKIHRKCIQGHFDRLSQDIDLDDTSAGTGRSSSSAEPLLSQAFGASVSASATDEDRATESRDSAAEELQAAKQNHGFDGLPNNQKIHTH